MATARERIRALGSVLTIADVRRLWVSQVLSEVGDWAARLALAVLVFDRSGSALLSAATLAVSYLPYLISPVLTGWAQRFSLRRLMIGADLMRGSLFALLILPLPVWTLLVLAFVAALATPPFEAARVGVTPDAAGEDRLPDALALSTITFQTAQVVGFGISGVLMALVGPQPALILNAATFFASAVVLFGMRAGRNRPEPEHAMTRVREAASAALRRPLLRRVIVLTLLVAFADAAVNALLPVFVRTNGYSPLVLTALAATAPLVGAVSGSVAPREGENARLVRVAAWLIVGGGGVAAVLFALTGVVTSTTAGIVVAVLAVAAFGATIAADIPAITVAMRSVDDELRAPLIAVVQPGLMGIQALGAVVAGAVALVLEPALVMSLALVVAVVYGVVVLARPARVIDLRDSSDSQDTLVEVDGHDSAHSD